MWLADGVSLLAPGYSAVMQSRLTGTSASQVQVILLPQPPELLGLLAGFHHVSQDSLDLPTSQSAHPSRPPKVLRLQACLPVGLQQLLEAGMEVVILLLQVVQTGVDLVQHGVDSGVFCFPETVVLAFRSRLHRHPQVPVGARHCGLGRPKGRVKMERVDRHEFLLPTNWEIPGRIATRVASVTLLAGRAVLPAPYVALLSAEYTGLGALLVGLGWSHSHKENSNSKR
ncbi:hypothetical protein AAY473_015026 [Plecturocebus cupreus]